MELLLRRLQAQIAPGDDSCPYRQAVGEILDLIQFPADDLDASLTPDEWPLEDLCNRMASRYSDILDVGVRDKGGTRDLVWDVLALPEIYSDPAVEPDAEHFFIALLIEEGIVRQLLTTNWDVLLEKAHRAIVASPERGLKSIASNDDMNGVGPLALFKVHGCADKAWRDRGAYGPFLVATEKQITGWGGNELSSPFRERANTILRETDAIFIGLSGQDGNLRNVVTASTDGRTLPYAADPPKIAFSAKVIDARRRSILKRIYSDYDERHEDIDAGACLPPCAKALLGSLYIDASREKLELLIADASADATFPSGFVPLLLEWRDWLEEAVSSEIDDRDEVEERWMWLARDLPKLISHVVSLMRRSRWTTTGDEYVALLPEDFQTLARPSPLREEGRYHWFLLAMAALCEGAKRDWWAIQAGSRDAADVGGASFVLHRADGRVGVIISSRPDAASALLQQHGVLRADSEEHVVLLYPHGHRPASRRSDALTRALPSAASSDLEEIWLQDLIEEGDVDSLVRALRHEILLAEAVV